MDSDALRDRWRAVAAWLDASPAELAGLATLVMGALAVVAVLWVTGRSGPVPGPAPAHTGHVPGAAAPTGGGPTEMAEVTVHVAGAVAQPGVVRLAAGSRVTDAIEAAGGALLGADPSSLNLARAVTDGERVDVPRVGEAVMDGTSVPDAAGDGAVRADGSVDLNRATAEDLETLPGVGPVLAERILAWRDEHGPFTEPGQLREVPGIGEKRFQELADRVAV